MRRVMFSLAALAAAGPALADEGACRPKVEEPCFSVHGRLEAYNGAPTFRLWIIGTRRVLGVSAEGAKSGRPDLPVVLGDKLGADAFSKRVFGDYQVCPITRERRGWMQMVCLKSASNLVVETR